MYEGWYSIREESFIDADVALERGFIDPVSGDALVRLKEQCHFFRLSRYHDAILQLLEQTEFLAPDWCRLEMVDSLKRRPLQDVPISRSAPICGIPCSDLGHVMHVGFESLARYLASSIRPNGTDIEQISLEEFIGNRIWSADPSGGAVQKGPVWACVATADRCTN